MARKLPADYIGDMSQLDMVLDARLVLARDGATDAEWSANSTLINRYSRGAWIAEGTTPARRATDIPVPADRDDRPAEWQRPTGSGVAGNTTSRRPTAGAPVTDGQRDLYTRLITDNITDESARAIALALLDTLTKTTISPLIDGLLKMEKFRKEQQHTTPAASSSRKTPAQLDATLPPVPDGRYRALGRNIKVDSPKQGQWAGRVFLVELDDEGHKLDRITRHTDKLALLTEIAADPHACVIAFGKATGSCGRCDTALEDPESIARGIGPYCEANSLGITVTEVYRDRKQHPAATINQPPAPAAETPAPRNESNAPAPAAARVAPATPATPPADVDADSLTAADIDAMTFAEAMRIPKALKVPGRGAARLPQLRTGIKNALTLAT